MINTQTKSGYLIVAAFCILYLTGCNSQEPGSYVEINQQKFYVTIANTDESRAKGLMFRESLPVNHGMLFIFPDENFRSFWMKNTLISLDILYFDRSGKLVSLQKNVQPCKSIRCPSYPSQAPAKYVLEINSGLSDQFNIKLGDHIKLNLTR